MCSRFRSIREWAQIHTDMISDLINFEFNPNVAPTDRSPAFFAGIDEKPIARLGSFGFNLPPKADQKGKLLINARTDNIERYFSKQLHQQRCAIPAEGFYEFRQSDAQPFFFHRKDGQPIWFAGIWNHTELKGDDVLGFAILTDEPNDLIRPFHDRWPCIISSPNDWLQAGSRPLEALTPIDIDLMAVRPVNRAVNRSAEKDLARIEAPPELPAQKSLF